MWKAGGIEEYTALAMALAGDLSNSSWPLHLPVIIVLAVSDSS